MVEVNRARGAARDALASELPERWAHVCAVAERAAALALALAPADGEVLEVAAWLHDVGYSAKHSFFGFHPLDGARYLTRSGADPRVSSLVARHSAAAVEADYLGLRDEMIAYEDENTIVRDLLWYCDMTTGPGGDSVSFQDRMLEVRTRYPADHYVSRALDASMPVREAAVRRAEAWIDGVGLIVQV